MAMVVLRKDESFNSLMSRFNKSVQNEKILSDVKEHQFFTPKSEKRSLKKKRKQLLSRGIE